MTSLWKNYDAKSSYDEYLTPERKLRKEAKIISSILDRHGKKKLQEIDRNCMSTIAVSYTHLTLPTTLSV